MKKNNEEIIQDFLKEFPEDYAHRGFVATIAVKLIQFLQENNLEICKKNPKE